MTSQTHTPRVLSIAGSDSGGGAGIQADLKAFARCGVHGMCAITALTAQNTVGVLAIHAVPGEIVLAQVRAVLGDIGVDAVKVGMLGSVEVTLAVARALRELPVGTPVVVDPVMVAESGARLLDADAERALVDEILPLATVVTPNVAEARASRARAAGSVTSSSVRRTRGRRMRGRRMRRESRARAAGSARNSRTRTRSASRARCSRWVRARRCLTGGHRARIVDLFVDSREGSAAVEIPGERHPDGAAHGSGCTHSACSRRSSRWDARRWRQRAWRGGSRGRR